MEHPQRRLLISFGIVVAAHAALLLIINMKFHQRQKELSLISDVEFFDERQVAAQADGAPAAPAPTIKEMFAQVFSPSRGPAQTKDSIYDMPSSPAPSRASGSATLQPGEAPIDLDRTELVRERAQKIDELVQMSGGSHARAADIVDLERQMPSASAPADGAMVVDKAALVEAVGTRRAAVSGSALVETTASRTRARSDTIGDMTPQRQKAQEIAALERTIADMPADRAALPSGAGGRARDTLYGSSPRSGGTIQLARTVPARPRREAELPVVTEKKEARAVQVKMDEIKTSPLEISGPLEKRKVLVASAPQYPAWAREQNIEANVVLKFYVDPAGRVLPNLFVTQTSGYAALDQVCKDNIQQWLFAPLQAGETQADQWGEITIRFRLQ